MAHQRSEFRLQNPSNVGMLSSLQGGQEDSALVLGHSYFRVPPKTQEAKKGFAKFSFRLQGWIWLHMPAITALGRMRKEDHCEFEANLGYRVNARSA